MIIIANSGTEVLNFIEAPKLFLRNDTQNYKCCVASVKACTEKRVNSGRYTQNQHVTPVKREKSKLLDNDECFMKAW